MGRSAGRLRWIIFLLNPESTPILVITLLNPVVVKVQRIHFCLHWLLVWAPPPTLYLFLFPLRKGSSAHWCFAIAKWTHTRLSCDQHSRKVIFLSFHPAIKQEESCTDETASSEQYAWSGKVMWTRSLRFFYSHMHRENGSFFNPIALISWPIAKQMWL